MSAAGALPLFLHMGAVRLLTMVRDDALARASEVVVLQW